MPGTCFLMNTFLWLTVPTLCGGEDSKIYEKTLEGVWRVFRHNSSPHRRLNLRRPNQKGKCAGSTLQELFLNYFLLFFLHMSHVLLSGSVRTWLLTTVYFYGCSCCNSVHTSSRTNNSLPTKPLLSLERRDCQLPELDRCCSLVYPVCL